MPDSIAARSQLWKFARWALLAALFGLAAWHRFSLPQTPRVDSDYGYLWPALSKLAGGAFERFQGVNFLYPGSVYCLTSLTGDFRAVTISQYLLGLGAGVLFWLIWQRLALFLPRWVWLHDLLGFAGLAVYLLSNVPTAQEAGLRPDAVCVFWEILGCWLGLEAFCAAKVFDRPRSALVWATLAGVSAVVLAALKPSFLLAALLLWFLLAFFVARRRGPWFGQVLFFLLPLLTFFSIAATQRALTRDDETTRLFLPRTLFTFHANLIDAQMQSDLASGAVPNESRAWLENAERELARATGRSSGRATIFPVLGYDADSLTNGSEALLWRWRGQLGPERFANFLHYWYWRSLRGEPLAFAGKIARQLGVFYRWPCPAFHSHRRLPWDYEVAARALTAPMTAKLLPQSAPGRALAANIQELQGPEHVAQEPIVIARAQKLLGSTFLTLFLFALAAVTVFVRRGLRVASGLLLVLYALIFCNVLSIAAVHSMEVSRYSEVLFLVALLAYLWTVRCAIGWWQAGRSGLAFR